MRIYLDLKDKTLSICNKRKEILIRYWGKLKFDKVIMYNPNEN